MDPVNQVDPLGLRELGGSAGPALGGLAGAVLGGLNSKRARGEGRNPGGYTGADHVGSDPTEVGPGPPDESGDWRLVSRRAPWENGEKKDYADWENSRTGDHVTTEAPTEAAQERAREQIAKAKKRMEDRLPWIEGTIEAIAATLAFLARCDLTPEQRHQAEAHLRGLEAELRLANLEQASDEAVIRSNERVAKGLSVPVPPDPQPDARPPGPATGLGGE